MAGLPKGRGMRSSVDSLSFSCWLQPPLKRPRRDASYPEEQHKALSVPVQARVSSTEIGLQGSEVYSDQTLEIVSSPINTATEADKLKGTNKKPLDIRAAADTEGYKVAKVPFRCICGAKIKPRFTGANKTGHKY